MVILIGVSYAEDSGRTIQIAVPRGDGAGRRKRSACGGHKARETGCSNQPG